MRYAESLAASQPSFDPLAQALAAPPTLVDRTLQRLALAAVDEHRPDVVLLSVPFPGAVYGAFRIAQALKAAHPALRIALGGGFVNTELRELSEARVFDYVDAVTLDAGAQLVDVAVTAVPASLPATLRAVTPMFEYSISAAVGRQKANPSAKANSGVVPLDIGPAIRQSLRGQVLRTGVEA